MAEQEGNTPKDYLYDVRLLERHVTQGRVTRQQLEKHLADIPDLADQAEAVDLGRLGNVSGARRKD